MAPGDCTVLHTPVALLLNFYNHCRLGGKELHLIRAHNGSTAQRHAIHVSMRNLHACRRGLVTLLVGLQQAALPGEDSCKTSSAAACRFNLHAPGAAGNRLAVTAGYHVAMTPTMYVTAPLGTVAHSDPERLHRSCTD
jgi:hypothetical protein